MFFIQRAWDEKSSMRSWLQKMNFPTDMCWLNYLEKILRKAGHKIPAIGI